MNLILKQLIIITGAFLIILWYQNVDDKKHNITRTTIYEKYKFPILVSAIIGLIINIPEILSSTSMQSCQENITEFTFITPFKNIMQKIPKMSGVDMARQSTKNIISDQQIYTDLPDF